MDGPPDTLNFFYDDPIALDLNYLNAAARRNEVAIGHHVDEIVAEASQARRAKHRRSHAHGAQKGSQLRLRPGARKIPKFVSFPCALRRRLTDDPVIIGNERLGPGYHEIHIKGPQEQ